jgi:hypothetical protein
MATRKKTETVVKPQTFTLTKEQFRVVKDAAIDVMEIRRKLDDLSGNDDISTIMFEVGQAAYIADKLEGQLDELRDSFEDNEWDDDNF